MSPSKAVFFDRDDTLIHDVPYLNDADKVEYMDGAFSECKRLFDSGFKIIIATNQSGVPRGLVTLDNLEKIHQRIEKDFASHGVVITDFYFSPHLPESDHPWRKPNPGMLLQAAKDHDIDLSLSWMVGDKPSDIEAGVRAGTKTIHVGSKDISNCAPPTHQMNSLIEVSTFILSHS